MLAATDPVTWKPQRTAIAGVSGSGKSTLANRLSERLHLPYVEIDSLYHGPNWQPRQTFVSDVERLIANDSWVIEWQYTAVRTQIIERADTMLWLDLPTPQTLYQLTRRTIHRRIHQVELWNGNREMPLHRFFTDPGHILRWGIRTRNKYRTLVPEIEKHHPALRIVRLTSRRQIEMWTNNVTANFTPDASRLDTARCRRH